MDRIETEFTRQCAGHTPYHQTVDARGTLCSSTTSAQPRVFPARKAINQRVGSGNGTAVVCLMRSIANRDVTSASVIPSTSRL